jgi:hypothetical protein
MGQRHQRGWLKKEQRAQGETWVLFLAEVATVCDHSVTRADVRF